MTYRDDVNNYGPWCALIPRTGTAVSAQLDGVVDDVVDDGAFRMLE